MNQPYIFCTLYHSKFIEPSELPSYKRFFFNLDCLAGVDFCFLGEGDCPETKYWHLKEQLAKKLIETPNLNQKSFYFIRFEVESFDVARFLTWQRNRADLPSLMLRVLEIRSLEKK